MTTYVALLRGINVGRAKRIAMADLRALVATLGYRDVRTLRNSGNLVFVGPRKPTSTVAAEVAAAIRRTLRIEVPTTVVTAQDLETIIDGNPLPQAASQPTRFLVAFMASPAALKRAAGLGTQSWVPDAISVGRKAAYLWCALGISASNLFLEIGKACANEVTTRNWSTVLKLRELSRAA